MNTILELIDIKKIIPHELTDQSIIDILINKIRGDGYWSNPVIIDKETMIIMDGHHRYEAAKIIGIKKIPCYIMGYHSNNVQIYNWKTNEKIDFNTIIQRVERGQKLPIKTTKHVFSIPLYEVKIDLNALYV